MSNIKSKSLILIVILSFSFNCFAQFRAKEINWTPDGTAYLKLSDGNIVKTDVKTNTETIIVKGSKLAKLFGE